MKIDILKSFIIDNFSLIWVKGLGGVKNVVIVKVLMMKYLCFFCSFCVVIRLVCVSKVRRIGNWKVMLNVRSSVVIKFRYLLIWFLFDNEIMFVKVWFVLVLSVRKN